MNLIFTAFATLEGYREGSNANLGSEVFYRCIVVSLISAKQKNQNCDAALVTNTAVPEPYAAQLSQAGIRVIACPFDNYRFEADLDWSLAYYKLCAMQYLLETEHYENYLMLDSDTFTQRGYQDIWREAAEAVLLYQVPHAASQPMTARISHTYDELWPEGAPHVLTHFGGEFVAGSTARLQDFMAECRNVFDRMQQTGVRSQDGDEAILDAAAYRSQLAGKPVRAANAYVFRYWLGGHFYYVSTNYCCDPVCVLHLPGKAHEHRREHQREAEPVDSLVIHIIPPVSQYMQKTQEKNGKNPEIFQLLRQRGIEFARRIVYNSFNY